MNDDGGATGLGGSSYALDFAKQALRTAMVAVPHLAGLAHTVRLVIDSRIDTAGVFASGRMLLNPDWLLRLPLPDAAFVLAHELMHLALQTHRREGGAKAEEVNWAHDYVINDMLRDAFHRPPPAGGLDLVGASRMSLEQVVMMLRSGQLSPQSSWGAGEGRQEPLRGGLGKSGPLIPQKQHANRKQSSSKTSSSARGDVLSDQREREWFSEATLATQVQRRQAVERAAARSVCLGKLWAAPGRGTEPGSEGHLTQALKGFYQTPWQSALQKWLETVAPAERSYARPSRRGADRTDVVLPGRTRTGWILNIVLDTSGSMSGELPIALGAIGYFCESVGVGQVRLLQCDTEVTSDEWLDPEALEEYEILGFGGSDMTPAMLRLAESPEVEAAIVLTDGWIDYPEQPVPYHVLWCVLFDPRYDDDLFDPRYDDDLFDPRYDDDLFDSHRDFQPPYGQVVYLPVVAPESSD